MSGAESGEARLLIYHKQATSGRTRYLQWGGTSVCAFSPLPDLSAVMESPPEVVPLAPPEGLLVRAAELLQIKPEELELELEFREYVDTPAGPVPVLLVALTTIDPPFDKAAAVDGKFIALTEARHLPPVELELLRRSYCCIMEG